MKLISPEAKPLDRRDALSLLRNGERKGKTKIRDAVRQNRARGALAVVAALLRPNQMQTLAQQVEQASRAVPGAIREAVH